MSCSLILLDIICEHLTKRVYFWLSYSTLNNRKSSKKEDIYGEKRKKGGTKEVVASFFGFS